MKNEEKKRIRIKFTLDLLMTGMIMGGLMLFAFTLTISPSNFQFMLFGFLTGLTLLIWTLDLMQKYEYYVKYKNK